MTADRHNGRLRVPETLAMRVTYGSTGRRIGAEEIPLGGAPFWLALEHRFAYEEELMAQDGPRQAAQAVDAKDPRLARAREEARP